MTSRSAATGATGAYAAAYEQSLRDPSGFWAEAAEGIDWVHEPRQILDDSTPPLYRWFPDGTLNTCFNALDRHVVDGRADQAALVYDSPVTGTGSGSPTPSCSIRSPVSPGCCATWGWAPATGW